MKAHHVALIGLAAGCPEPEEESDTSCECCPGECDTEPPDPVVEWSWSEQGLTMTITNVQSTGFDLGLAETADPDNGWFGEDCLHGTPPYNMCHILNGSMTGTLDSVHDEIEAGGSFDLVVQNETTYFDQSFADRLTYAVTVDGGDCWVFGHDPSYYKASPSFADCSLVP